MRYEARNISIQIESDLAMVVWLEEASKTLSDQPSPAVDSFMLIQRVKNAVKLYVKQNIEATLNNFSEKCHINSQKSQFEAFSCVFGIGKKTSKMRK